ncbi:MAG: hypothetical protein AVDCRST_MAG29-2489, partial [uncultured Nocardioidaceae bacterium]
AGSSRASGRSADALGGDLVVPTAGRPAGPASSQRHRAVLLPRPDCAKRPVVEHRPCDIWTSRPGSARGVDGRCGLGLRQASTSSCAPARPGPAGCARRDPGFPTRQGRVASGHAARLLGRWRGTC